MSEPLPPQGGLPPQVRGWSRYVALGDSFTEGLWDVDPARPGQLRGWADRVAERLSDARRDADLPPLEYANLAVRGRLLPSIIAEQVPAALDLNPDLVSLVGGGNDVLRPAVDVDRLASELEAAVVRLRTAGADVLLCTGVDPVDSPLLRATRGRVALLNSHVWSIAARHDAYVLDVWGLRSLRDWDLWDADRIHLTPEGHARVAQAALASLGLEPDDARWADPPVPGPANGRSTRLRDDAEWLRSHVFPWAARRLRSGASGQERLPKQPLYRPVTAAVPAGRPDDPSRQAREPLD